MSRFENQKKLPFTITLIIVCILVALAGVVYIYGDFINRNPHQLSNMVEVSRDFPNLDSNKIDSSYVDSKFLEFTTDISSSETKPPINNSLPDFIIGEQKQIGDQEIEEKTKSEDNNLIRNSKNIQLQPAQIFFIKITDSGHMSLKQLNKNIREDLPTINATLESLLEGPSSFDRNHGIQTMIPQGSQLLSVSIKDKIAHLNFNEEFMFNTFGTDGYNAQLQQVIYTATEISPIKEVQITVDGNKVEFLYEGIYVGKPLSRDSFR